MSVELAVVSLTYIIILVVCYVLITVSDRKDEKVILIINKAYQFAYSILLFGFLIVCLLIKLPHITLDTQTTSFLILACKLISVLTLGGSIYVLRRKFSKN
jgi:hypothetical protein